MAAALTEFSLPARKFREKQAVAAWHARLRRQRSGAVKNTVKPYFQCVADADGGHRKKEITTIARAAARAARQDRHLCFFLSQPSEKRSYQLGPSGSHCMPIVQRAP
ncbi:hypothetical protein [Achromobacter sp. Bel]|uniref:hypothetical protein n=1 Tax=Achromobacter sp. Bel TaxID=2727415 RepID=UPI00145D2C79|nr:hypothetical protein [Achromobacter sp. Bel]NMK49440.1 hypothetical protein [Achromobacter sp. Bel]